jgi:putative transposase
MPRRLRKAAGNVVYHVINRANMRLQIFKKSGDFLAFERVLAQGLARIPMRLCGYCIMGNHWHLLLWPREDGEMSEFMQWITTTHMRRWHAAHSTTGFGHVYQGRFKSFPVQSSEYYLKTLQYIESNPLRAKLVKNSCDWQYSSLAIRNGIDKQGLKIFKGPVKLPANWNKHVNIVPNEATEARLQNCIIRGTPFGGDTWTKTISQKLGLESTLRPRCRPKKSG